MGFWAWTQPARALLDPASWQREPERSGAWAMLALLGALAASRMAWGWTPLLDSATLALHEAGHPVFSILGERWTVYGGAIFQLLFPSLFCRHFLREGRPLGFCFALGWAGSAWGAMGRYMADAREQALPLVGGGGEAAHDWTEIFGRWGLLAWDREIGGLAGLAGWGLMGAAALLAWRLARRA